MTSDPAALSALRANATFTALARSLRHETEVRGAALMVGAGMSRNAVRLDPTSPQPPLWGELLREMSADLGLQNNEAPGALRLAEQYEETFGRGRLEGLVRRLVADAGWEPGRAHERLLRLPWVDVFTTNYDTLLERGAQRIIERLYEPVLTPEDIARTRSPRIVKLHGTLPSHTPFIITESDYRTYPERFAPYVNLARQVILENDILMVGFSGDDPNFTAWTGWVRAEMAPYARTLFLAGLLDLDGAGRDRLRERGIVPIDLGPLVPDLDGNRDRRSARAINLLLDALEQEKPSDPKNWAGGEPWPSSIEHPAVPVVPGQPWRDLHDPTFAASYVEQSVERWRRERQTYPGWIEPPPQVGDMVRSELTHHMHALQTGLAQARVQRPAQVLADVIWRLDLVHGTLFDDRLDWLAETAAGLNFAHLSQVDRTLLGRVLIREYRDREDRPGFDRWIDWLSQDADDDPETAATVAYEQALWWRDRLAYDQLRPLIDTVRGSDPAWHLRRGALWAELGRTDELSIALLDAWQQIAANVTRTRSSIWMRSRLAWTGWIANAMTHWSAPERRVPEFVTAGFAARDGAQKIDPTYDPWDIVTRLDDDIAAAEKKTIEERRSIRAEFDAGVTRGPGRTWYAAPIVSVERNAVRLADRIGIPPTCGNFTNITTTRIATAASVSAGPDRIGMMRCLLAASRDADALIKARFNRVEIARLGADVVEELARRTEAAIAARLASVRLANAAGGIPDRGRMPSLSALTEMLSRFVVRLSPTQAASVLDRALVLARDPAWALPMLFEPLGTLVRRAYEAVPPEDRRRFGAALASFPLPSEKGADHPRTGWPNPLAMIHDLTIAQGPELSLAVADLLVTAASNHPADTVAAVQRLTCLSTLSALTAQERAAYGTLTWGRRYADDGPRAWLGDGIPALYETSSPDPSERARWIRAAVTERLMGEGGQPSEVALWMLRKLGSSGGAALRELLTAEEIAQAVDTLIAWRPPVADRDEGLLDFTSQINERFSVETARALTFALLPALSVQDVGEERAGRWAALATDLPSAFHLAALPHMARLGLSPVDVVVNVIQRSLLSRESLVTVWALFAVEVWLDIRHRLAFEPVLMRDVVGLVALRCDRAMPHALTVARCLVEADLMPAGEIRRILIGLDELAAETDYAAWSGDDVGATNLTLIRAEAVRLSAALVRRGVDNGPAMRWLQVARTDPMPEVRHAAMDDEHELEDS